MKQIITIGREFGAGGGELGRRLARELGIAYYDRDIILRTAKAGAHLTPEQVRRWDERVPHEFGFTQSLFNFYERPLSEELWDAQDCRQGKLCYRWPQCGLHPTRIRPLPARVCACRP